MKTEGDSERYPITRLAVKRGCPVCGEALPGIITKTIAS